MLINYAHILYYCMDALRSTFLGCSYFIIPDYLIVNIWVNAIFLFQDLIVLTWTHTYRYQKKSAWRWITLLMSFCVIALLLFLTCLFAKLAFPAL